MLIAQGVKVHELMIEKLKMPSRSGNGVSKPIQGKKKDGHQENVLIEGIELSPSMFTTAQAVAAMTTGTATKSPSHCHHSNAKHHTRACHLVSRGDRNVKQPSR
ncbi:MAG: hypothetical protein VXZ82_16745 [Planctomycetota bacterium]|nr:hypothetical protein [Planctomycetota bacterium]